MAQKNDPISDARKQFLDAIPKAEQAFETIPLEEANGRILAKGLSAGLHDPPYSRSIMEGFVLCTVRFP